MHSVSLLRLYLLRAVYLLIATGLAAFVWPNVLHNSSTWGLMQGVVQCMLAVFSVLLLLGVRYPLQMLPLLLWELGWKALWLSIVAYPLWKAGQLDQATAKVAGACLMAIVVPLVIPWTYVYERYLKHASERWR